VARPPNRLTSSRACGPGQYASILRAFELGHVMNTTLEGPRNRRRSAHASSHFFELRRVQRCRRALAFGLSASAEFVGERDPVLRCAIVCAMRPLLYGRLEKISLANRENVRQASPAYARFRLCETSTTYHRCQRDLGGHVVCYPI
jgi:hypothetical protein